LPFGLGAWAGPPILSVTVVIVVRIVEVPPGAHVVIVVLEVVVTYTVEVMLVVVVTVDAEKCGAKGAASVGFQGVDN